MLEQSQYSLHTRYHQHHTENIPVGMLFTTSFANLLDLLLRERCQGGFTRGVADRRFGGVFESDPSARGTIMMGDSGMLPEYSNHGGVCGLGQTSVKDVGVLDLGQWVGGPRPGQAQLAGRKGGGGLNQDENETGLWDS